MIYALAKKSIMVLSLLIGNHCLQYLLTMGLLTSAPGVFLVKNRSQAEISNQILALMEHLKACHAGRSLNEVSSVNFRMEIVDSGITADLMAAHSEDDIRIPLENMPSITLSRLSVLQILERCLRRFIHEYFLTNIQTTKGDEFDMEDDESLHFESSNFHEPTAFAQSLFPLKIIPQEVFNMVLREMAIANVADFLKV